MIDTGATQSIIRSNKVNAFNVQKHFHRSIPQPLLADGKTSLAVNGETELTLEFDGHGTKIIALVVKDLFVDFIIGMDFIRKYRVNIDAKKETVTMMIGSKVVELSILNDSKEYYPSMKSWNKQKTKKCYNSEGREKSTNIINTTVQTSSNENKDRTKNSKEDWTKEIDELIKHIKDQNEHEKLSKVLQLHGELFDTKQPRIAVNVQEHEINTIEHPPSSSKPYYSTPAKHQALRDIVRGLLENGLIRKSFSPYSAPALLVEKKDRSWRMVVDYKKLNQITVKDNHPLPNMEQAIQTLGGGYFYFSKLDMKSGFWQIPIAEKDKHKTAFVTPDGLYEWNVLPQGLKNSPPSFQRVMTEVLSSCRKFSLVYIDDIIIFSRSFDEHVDHLSQVLKKLSDHNLQLNLSKCKIAHVNIEYLSHWITHTSVQPNQEKILAILKLREPKTLAEANKFIGGLSWYRKFIPGFASIAAPILSVANLTKKNRKNFKWTQAQHEAFNSLKKVLTNKPLFLDFPRDNLPLLLTTDASKVGIGGTLQQVIDGETKNLYYHSQVLSPSQRRYDPIELEALAIWLCFKRMKSYLVGRSITIYTDHCPLCSMMKKSVKNRRVDRISVLLQEFNIEKIIHIKGKQNCLADYLSRHPIQNEEEIFNEDYGIGKLFQEETLTEGENFDSDNIVSAVTTRSTQHKLNQQTEERNLLRTAVDSQNIEAVAENVLLDRYDPIQNEVTSEFNSEAIRKAQENDPMIKKRRTEIESGQSEKFYKLKDGLLYKIIGRDTEYCKRREVVYLPRSLIDLILRSYHTVSTGGHFGVRRTYNKILRHYWWPSMKIDIYRFIKSCLPCQQHNVHREKKPGHLCPIETPSGPFQMIGVDFCGPLQRTPEGNQYIIVITDYFTRWITAAAVPNASAYTAAETIFNQYICHYGVPICILSDQGTHFRNQMMSTMSKMLGCDQKFSTVYHPQTNGMVERFNATIVPQIAKLQDRHSNNWDNFLPAVVFGYNTGIHSTTGFAPFQLLYGREPRLPPDPPASSFVFQRPTDYYEQLKRKVSMILEITRATTNRKQSIYKKHYDKTRRDPKYDVGTQVLIRKHGSKSKLDPIFSTTIYEIIENKHPVYYVTDGTNGLSRQVHVNDIRPINLETKN